MWSRIKDHTERLSRNTIDLKVKQSVWRGKLYEVGHVAGVEYETDNLPAEDELVADLREALELYSLLSQAGGWIADDDILREGQADGAADSLEQAKRYRQHRAIERQPKHSKLVKKKLGTRCMGCLFELRELYGPVAAGFIEAHHLIPLSNLDDDTVIRFDPERHFAVLCPNCHRIIHRMDDCSDIDALRTLVRSGPLANVLSALRVDSD
jgi:5-methylcytosine-specific restriction enzyme A